MKGTDDSLYNLQRLTALLKPTWDGDRWWLLSFSHRGDAADQQVLALIRAFKRNEARAVHWVSRQLQAVLVGEAARLRHQLQCRFLVAAPTHRPGGPSPAAVSTCQALAAALPWLTWLPGALQRTAPVTPSAGAPPSRRPGLEGHRHTLRYTGPRDARTENAAFILFDDVLGTGATASACGQVLREQAGCPRVISLFIARVRDIPLLS